MDLRIVNICNNNCLYCLESSLRNKEKYISIDHLFSEMNKKTDNRNITFYWWNPLLHPQLSDIIENSKKIWFKSIGLLSNTNWLNKIFLNTIISKWLTSFWIYFNSFNKKNHELVNWWGISYVKYLSNLTLLSNSWLNLKIIVHINNLNIKYLARDILILKKKYGFTSFDFINYFPFDKPYDNKEILEYNISDYTCEIHLLFKIIKKNNLKVNFLKFSKDFFWIYREFYNYNKWIVKQIWEEDIIRLSWKNPPFCFIEKRCMKCFIKDKCKYYEV